MYVWFDDGYARWICMFGLMFTAIATYAARQVPHLATLPAISTVVGVELLHRQPVPRCALRQT